MSTAKQEQALAFVRDQLEQFGVAPTIDELARHLGGQAHSARSIVEALIRQKRLIRTRAGQRNLAIVGLVDLTSVGTDAMRAELARRGVTMDALDQPKATQGRACAAHGCVSLVQPGNLMCRPHWFAVPQPIRTAILNAHRARHLQAYGEAVEAARDHLGGFERVMERSS